MIPWKAKTKKGLLQTLGSMLLQLFGKAGMRSSNLRSSYENLISSYINLIWKQGLWPCCKLYGWLIKPIRNWALFTTHLHCYLKGMKKIILWTITKYWATQFECVGFLNSLVEEVNDRAQLCIYCPSTKSLTVCPEETLTKLISLYRRCSYHF